jgi:septal ring factor EnvC (AmiA/AmiB activator)
MVQLQMVDSVKSEQHRNAIQDCRLADQDNRISTLAKQNEEILQTLNKFTKKLMLNEAQLQAFQDSVQFLEAEIPYLRNLVHRNEELQNERNFFCAPD